MNLPARVEDAMADIAAVFHWPPEPMDRMALAELAGWRAQAIDRFRQMNGGAR